jgi:adenylate cyclase
VHCAASGRGATPALRARMIIPEHKASAVVLFADITQGSGLFNELGDTWAVDVVAAVHEHLREIVKRHRGRVVKTIGTEMMCAFAGPDRAVMCSGDMHLRIRRAGDYADPARREEVGLRDVRLRIGLHLGPVIEEPGDVFGDTVNVAARLMSMAKADQTLCARSVIDGLSRELLSTTRFFDRLSPKGKTEAIEIHEVIWEVEDLTMAAPVIQVPAPRKRHQKLVLHCESMQFELGNDLTTLSIGRSDDNDLIYPGDFASRKHATIEYERGRFTIADESANGTYVVIEGGSMVAVRRERHTLDGSGRVYLGELPQNYPSVFIFYECE